MEERKYFESIKNRLFKGSILVFDDIKPYKTMDKFFAAVGSFQHKENKGHRFGKSKKDELTLSFSTMGIVASVELVRASSQLFSVNKDR